ncbi:MAG: hypothetical protein E6772_02560 [Dysgonomonas sp.]|nr:hypothetical protein [Dysgonomonas sp.]
MRRVFIITISHFLFLPMVLLSQNADRWDKELRVILTKKDIADSLKIISVSDLFLENRYLLDETSLPIYLNNVLPLIGQSNTDESKTYIYSSAILLTNDIEEKLPILDSCILYLEKISNPLIKARGWNNIGKAQIREARSLNYFQNALNEINGKGFYKQEADIFMNMSSFYQNQKDHSNQVKYSKQALESAQNTKDTVCIIKAWNSLGEAYLNIPTNDFDNEALKAYSTSLEMYKALEKTSGYKNDYLHTILCINIGCAYYQLDENETAINYLNDALILAIQNKFTDLQVACYKYLSRIERDKENYQEAADYLFNAESLLPEISLNNEENWHFLYDIYIELATIYQMANMPKEAAECMQIGLEEYRKIFDLQLAYDNQLLTTSYEIEQKEQEIAAGKELLSSKKRQTYLYIGIAIVLCIGLFFLYRLFNYRISAAKQAEKNKSKELELLRLDKSYVTLRNELKLQESEQLQKQLASGNDLVEQKNRIFENLQQFFATHAEFDKYREQVESILTQQNRIENKVEDLKSISEGVPAAFYDHLQEHADNKLTLLDLKYCRLIYLDISTKEMAEQLFVEPSTIRVSKYRLKQKLNLDKDADLNQFIQNIAKHEL